MGDVDRTATIHFSGSIVPKPMLRIHAGLLPMGRLPFISGGRSVLASYPLTLSSLLSPFFSPSLPISSPFLFSLLPSLPTLLDRKGMDSPWRVWEISESNFQASEVSRVGYHPHSCEPLQCQACRHERAKRPFTISTSSLLRVSVPEHPHGLPKQRPSAFHIL